MRLSLSLRFITDLLVVAFCLIVAIIMIFPFLWVVITSIRPDSEMFASTFQLIPKLVTFANYQALFASSFASYIVNSIIVCCCATLLSCTVALLAAYSFSRKRFRGRGVLLLSISFSQLFPFVILITPIYAIFYSLGLVNNFLGLIIAYIAITLPFSIYMLYGYLDAVPYELDEAAIVDGCSTLGVIFRVIVPVAGPGIAATAVYMFISTWEEFLFAQTLMTNGANWTVPVGLASFIGEYTSQWGTMMAASVVSTIPTLILFFFIQRRLVSNLTVGAVKG
ncbi:sugar ABC transporter permease [Reticulibacter mediterranei]|uniref:Sugar ABC transporter permease n=1 Tax=Reticulibacter mediterranei TaxID=2778369 RepID=A0A8J3ISM0_9CHLR|nr:carbohydrate ABC transporter permease [Reticulibacter mediterranei]GHO97144.1 sugar ABC transporter permease [Reticulibacter mediterranei]